MRRWPIAIFTLGSFIFLFMMGRSIPRLSSKGGPPQPDKPRLQPLIASPDRS
jgi:hypothetical protein